MTAKDHSDRDEQIFAEHVLARMGNFAEHSIDLGPSTISPLRGRPVKALFHGGFTLGAFSPKIAPQMLGQLPPDAKGLM